MEVDIYDVEFLGEFIKPDVKLYNKYVIDGIKT